MFTFFILDTVRALQFLWTTQRFKKYTTKITDGFVHSFKLTDIYVRAPKRSDSTFENDLMR